MVSYHLFSPLEWFLSSTTIIELPSIFIDFELAQWERINGKEPQFM